MIDELKDIMILENALILIEEGASDEKRMAIDSLNKMLEQKKNTVEKFELEAV